MDNTIIKVDEIPRVEWRNERVMTTAQLAEFYETSEGNLRVNFFNAQKEGRFIDGKHFFKLEGDDLQNLRVKNLYPQISPMTRVLYLWTKRGAARHAKMLNTDRAWEVFEALEDNYFNRPAVAVYSETLALEREKIAVEREKLTLARDNFAKAQLLRDIASSSRDDVLRDKLIREATKIFMGDDFLKKIPDEDDESICT